MNTLFKHEFRQNFKSLIIWTLCIGSMCFGCILLFDSLKDSMKDMADSFASMGAFSQAFGMDKLNIATLAGYYASEIGTIHGLGGAMFSAILGILLLSKEEEAHTSEFLFGLPIGRLQAAIIKYGIMVTLLVIFNACCVALYVLGIIVTDGDLSLKHFFLFHLMQLLMQIEIASICFLISAVSKRNKTGLGIGLALVFYAVDMMARIVPAIEKLKYVTPFSYANAADIFCGEPVSLFSLLFGIGIIITVTAAAFVIYQKKDLAS